MRLQLIATLASAISRPVDKALTRLVNASHL